MRKLLALALFVMPVFAGQIPDPAKIKHTTGEFQRCPPIGDAKLADEPKPGRSDPYLNALKNRDVPPKEAEYKTTKVSMILADVPAGATAAGRRRRDAWTAAQRASVDAKEKQAIQVVGFLVRVQKERKESCNCGDKKRVDYHMWLVQHEGDDRSKSLVVEISPRLLEAHPDWPKLAAKAAREGTLVRIRGWRTWDEEHPEQLKLTRGTMWEIHPIHEIDVADEHGDWVSIDGHEEDIAVDVDASGAGNHGRSRPKHR